MGCFWRPGSIWPRADFFGIAAKILPYCGVYFQIFSPTVVQYFVFSYFQPFCGTNFPIGNNPTDRREISEVEKHPSVITGCYFASRKLAYGSYRAAPQHTQNGPPDSRINVLVCPRTNNMALARAISRSLNWTLMCLGLA